MKNLKKILMLTTFFLSERRKIHRRISRGENLKTTVRKINGRSRIIGKLVGLAAEGVEHQGHRREVR